MIYIVDIPRDGDATAWSALDKGAFCQALIPEALRRDDCPPELTFDALRDWLPGDLRERRFYMSYTEAETETDWDFPGARECQSCICEMSGRLPVGEYISREIEWLATMRGSYADITDFDIRGLRTAAQRKYALLGRLPMREMIEAQLEELRDCEEEDYAK